MMNTCVAVPEGGTPDARPDVSNDVEGGAQDAETGSPDAEAGSQDAEAGAQDAEAGSDGEGGPPDGGIDAGADASSG
jgi:hypothetical protein